MAGMLMQASEIGKAEIDFSPISAIILYSGIDDNHMEGFLGAFASSRRGSWLRRKTS
jgi:hypothetical protein